MRTVQCHHAPLHSIRAHAQVTYRLTYEDVEDMLATGLAGPESDEWELGRLDELAQLRFRYETCFEQSILESAVVR